MTNIPVIVRDYANQRDRWAAAQQAANSPLAQPGTRAPSISELAVIMDNACKAIRDLPEFEGFTPLDWESFCELLPNLRKVMGIQGGEGGW